MKTAIVIGATGVTGKHITSHLLANDAYGQVIVFSRRTLTQKHPKLVVHLVDFERIDDWAELIQGDDLFSALGTTLKQAGSKQAQYKVDYTYQANVIEAAATNGVKRLFVVSSPQATPKSPIFYNRIKGELDEFAATQGFATLVYFKPSIIKGDRPDHRLGEKIGGAVVGAISKWVPGAQKFRPITGEELGTAIVNCASGELPEGTHTYELDEIFGLLAD
ncbi:MAG: NAD(P)H-binding protein [Proteobacteria bacterium]|nr:NAD(P)H-binding protein [Pseudomonadota bacterium]